MQNGKSVCRRSFVKDVNLGIRILDNVIAKVLFIKKYSQKIVEIDAKILPFQDNEHPAPVSFCHQLVY